MWRQLLSANPRSRHRNGVRTGATTYPCLSIRSRREQSLNATSRDVSIGGVYICLRSSGNLHAGTEFDITLALPQELPAMSKCLSVRMGRPFASIRRRETGAAARE